MTAIAATPADARPLVFACRVQGAEAIAPAMTPQAVCARFQASLDAALGTASRLATDSAIPASARRWVHVDLSFKPTGVAVAKLSYRLSGLVVHAEPISYSVSDRQIGADMVKHFADAVAASIRAR